MITRRIHILGNPSKTQAGPTVAELQRFAATRCEVVGADLSLDGRTALAAGAECIVVVGGDGTIISVARFLGHEQRPLVGVNVGRLGFITEFSVEEFKQQFDRIMDPGAEVSRRIALQVDVRGAKQQLSTLAINDCVIHAGSPFRMIELGVHIDGQHLTDVAGDGLVVSTPCGSTAHNLSAGGPILQSDIDAIVLTPLAPHSLTHRPLVIARNSQIEILALEANVGTTAIVDGQVPCSLGRGDRVHIRRHDTDMQLVRNPLHTRWKNLVSKLHWGQLPRND